MDIAALSTSMAQVRVNNDVGTALLSKSLDMMETTGEKMVEMLDAAAMERSVNPKVGGNFDISISFLVNCYAKFSALKIRGSS